MTDPEWSRSILPGGRVVPDPHRRPATGSWRTGFYPVLDPSRCVDCLICWVYCPDRAIETVDGHVAGINLQLCKGCEICVATCPAQAIGMLADTRESGGD